MYQLRKYQQEAVNATLQYFRKQRNPGVIVLPTGAGKSLVIAELAKVARGRVLVLAHVKELVEQNFSKYQSYGLEAGIFSAGLQRKDTLQKVIFGSIQSVARARADFFQDFSLLIIDECHRVDVEEESQYASVIKKLKTAEPQICILGLTATPYRLGYGWIYQYNHKGMLRSEEPRFFRKCIYDVSLKFMIDQGYLTPPIAIDSPVSCYDFSSLKLSPSGKNFAISDIEDLLKDQKRVTPVIVKNVVEMSKQRHGVMLFTASVRHANEILSHLPPSESAIVVGDTPSEERDQIIRKFKERKIKFLVNVSVLTTGFDAPHVDVIAILRPTESISLYQQIVGRGLRISEGKEDCLVLDYTGQGHNVFFPVIEESRPRDEAVPVEVICPRCGHSNDFWGLVDLEGNVVEHFGRKCRGAVEEHETFKVVPCGFRFRFKSCPRCGNENDIAARTCNHCEFLLVDNDVKLREAMALKDAHVMRPDTMLFVKGVDKKGQSRLEIRYYDLDGQHLTEYFYLNSKTDSKAFYFNFSRMHNRLPEKEIFITSVDDAIAQRERFRIPSFVIARKQKYFWQIREKIFSL